MSTTRSQRLKARASQHLTAGHTPELAAQMRATRPGQAHWAGTGPAGKTCGQCSHLGYWEQVRNSTGDTVYSRHRTGCAKFFQLTGKHGAVIPPAAGACRHFQPHNEATKQGKMK
jgi:hypothetical protein